MPLLHQQASFYICKQQNVAGLEKEYIILRPVFIYLVCQGTAVALQTSSFVIDLHVVATAAALFSAPVSPQIHPFWTFCPLFTLYRCCTALGNRKVDPMHIFFRHITFNYYPF